MDPRRTRLARQQAARREAGQGTIGNLSNEGIFHTVSQVNDEQGILYSRRVDQPVSSRICHSLFLNSLSVSALDILKSQSSGVVQNFLEPGAVYNDALYISDVNDVACMDGPCNKRISDAGPERSAGATGHQALWC